MGDATIRPLASADEILRMAQAFQNSRTLLAGVELGVFAALGEETLAPAKVAKKISADPRATDRLLHALAALGLLRLQNGKFANTDAGLRHLLPTASGYLGALNHHARLYRAWATLPEAVRRGGTVAGPHPVLDGTWTEDFIAAMHARARLAAEEVADALDLRGVRRMLDVGGGSGAFSMALCQRKAELSAVVLDLPQVTPITRRYLAQDKLSGRVRTQDGDYREADFGSGFDLVLFSSIMHINSPEENRALLLKAYAALAPGGAVVISDYIMDPSRTAPKRGALFALNMIINTPRGDTYTEDEYRAWLREAGCTAVTRTDTRESFSLMVGRKQR